jgi:RecA/RadA recombinase
MDIKEIDELLGGGFEQSLFYLIYGDGDIHKLVTRLAIRAQLPRTHGGLNSSVVLIDGANRFNPYTVAHIAAEYGLSSVKVLENINIVRAFNQTMMNETIQEKLAMIVARVKAKVVLITGLATHLIAERQHESEIKTLTHEAVTIRNIAMKHNAMVIASTPLAPNSEWKPSGGTALQHAAQVHIAAKTHKKRITYYLMKHPSIPQRKTVVWKGPTPNQAPTLSLELFLDTANSGGPQNG